MTSDIAIVCHVLCDTPLFFDDVTLICVFSVSLAYYKVILLHYFSFPFFKYKSITVNDNMIITSQ